MDTLSTVLPVVIDVLLVVLLTVLIILGIKTIYLVKDARRVVNNVNDKLNTLNGLFSLVNIISEKITELSDAVINFFEKTISKLINRRSRKKEDE